MIPFDVHDDRGRKRIAFAVRATDAVVSGIGDHAFYTFKPVIINVRNIRLLYVLLKIDQHPDWAYETSFDLGLDAMNTDVRILIGQPEIPIVPIGKATCRNIIVRAPEFQVHLRALYDEILASGPAWSHQQYMQAIAHVQARTQSPMALWNSIDDAGVYIAQHGLRFRSD